MNATDAEPQYESVVCDIDHAQMKFGDLTHPKGMLHLVLTGWKCTAPGCTRFFGVHMTGVKGYADLTDESEFANVRLEPSCSSSHEPEPMYLQRAENKLRWLCPVCDSEVPFRSLA